MKRQAGLRLTIPIIALLLLGMAIGLASHVTRRAEHAQARQMLLTQVRERLNHFQISAEAFTRLNRIDLLQQLISSVAAEPDLVQMLIAGPHGRILASNHFAQIGEPWQSAAPDLDRAQIMSVLQSHAISNRNAPDSKLIDGYSSVCGFQDESALRLSACGFIAYRVSLTPHLQKTDTVLAHQTLYFAAGSFGVMLLLLLLLDLLITRRAHQIIATLQAFVAGDRQQRIPVGLHDEIGWISSTINHMLDEVVASELDITDQRERLRAIFATVADAIITIDSKGIIQTVNPATERLMGYDGDELIGRNVAILMPAGIRAEHGGYIDRYLTTGERRIIGLGREVEAVTKSGHTFPVELNVSEMRIGGQRMFTGVLRDITERVAMREAMEKVNAELVSTNQSLWKSAKTDSLTGLGNRRAFDETLETELRRASRHARPLSLILIDLDYFKGYNDSYGHLEGDNCLKAIAGVLNDTCQRSGELAVRYGGEEFAVILPDCPAAQARETAERICAAIEARQIPHVASAVSDWVTASLGVTSYCPGNTRIPAPRGLIERADQALYQAKAAGRNRVREITPSSPASSGGGQQQSD